MRAASGHAEVPHPKKEPGGHLPYAFFCGKKLFYRRNQGLQGRRGRRIFLLNNKICISYVTASRCNCRNIFGNFSRPRRLRAGPGVCGFFISRGGGQASRPFPIRPVLSAGLSFHKHRLPIPPAPASPSGAAVRPCCGRCKCGWYRCCCGPEYLRGAPHPGIACSTSRRTDALNYAGNPFSP